MAHRISNNRFWVIKPAFIWQGIIIIERLELQMGMQDIQYFTKGKVFVYNTYHSRNPLAGKYEYVFIRIF